MQVTSSWLEWEFLKDDEQRSDEQITLWIKRKWKKKSYTRKWFVLVKAKICDIYIYKGQYYHTLSESLRYECPNFMLIGELFDYAIFLLIVLFIN